MNRKTLAGTMLLAIFASLLLTIDRANAQYEGSAEVIKFTYGNLDQRSGVEVRNRDGFLANPVRTLRQQGVDVPQSAEAPWQAFAIALRKLANPNFAARAASNRPKGGEHITYKIDLVDGPEVALNIAGDWNSKGTTTAADRTSDSSRFLINPVATLRAHKVKVQAADERAWGQLAGALKDLRDAYSRIRFDRNAEGQSAPTKRNERIDPGSTQATAVRGWDPKKKVEVTGSSDTTQKQTSVNHSDPKGDVDRPIILGSIPNSATSKAVGTCNTASGCKKLKDACTSIKNHDFKANNADASLGTCIDRAYDPATSAFDLKNSNTSSSRKNPAADVELAAPKKSSEATLYCHGPVMCKKVKKICAATGGTYAPIYDLSGSCRLAQRGANVSETQLAKSNEPSLSKTGSTRLKAETRSTPAMDSRAGSSVLKSTDSGNTWIVVGTCNTARGCVALKDACGSFKGHSFKTTNAEGDLGTCSAKSVFFLRNTNSPGSGNPQPPTKPAGDLGLASPRKTSEAIIYCHGAVFCRKVKNICATLGGSYRPINDLSGACQY